MNAQLKYGEKYSILLSIQYTKMERRRTSTIRRCAKEFIFEKETELQAKEAS